MFLISANKIRHEKKGIILLGWNNIICHEETRGIGEIFSEQLHYTCTVDHQRLIVARLIVTDALMRCDVRVQLGQLRLRLTFTLSVIEEMIDVSVS